MSSSSVWNAVLRDGALFFFLQWPAIGPRGELPQFRLLLGDRRFQLFLELLCPFAEGVALPLVVREQFLRLILSHEADELRQVVILGNRLLADKAVFLPEAVEILEWRFRARLPSVSLAEGEVGGSRHRRPRFGCAAQSTLRASRFDRELRS